MATAITDVITGIATQIAAITPLPDGTYPRVRDLNDTPISLEQGDCPQVFFHPDDNRETRLTFDKDGLPGNPGHVQRDFQITGYFVDVSENLDQAWASRPRVAAWSDAFVAKMATDDSLGIADLHTHVSAKVRDGLRFNDIPFRGAILTISGYWFT